MATASLPLVLLHGYPLDHSIWFGVIAALGSGIRTIAPDLPGFGKTPALRTEPSIDALADDVLALLKREKIERAIFAGMSMGGYVALAIAERAPEKVAGLALLNSQCYADTDEGRAARGELIKKVRAEGPSAAARAIIPKLFSSAHAENPDFQKFAIDGAEAAGVEGITWALEAMAKRPDRCHVLAKAKAPVLILHSADDRIIPNEKARQMAELNPATHFFLAPNAGHGAVMEAPDEVASTLRKFVEICAYPPEPITV